VHTSGNSLELYQQFSPDIFCYLICPDVSSGMRSSRFLLGTVINADADYSSVTARPMSPAHQFEKRMLESTLNFESKFQRLVFLLIQIQIKFQVIPY